MWEKLNEKKTTIGAALLLVATLISGLTAIWAGENPPDWIPKLIETLQWLGGIFAGVGLTHKGFKVVSPKRNSAFKGK